MLRSTIRVLKAARQHGSNLSSNRSGVAAIEFAVAGPIFIALLLATFYTVLIFLAQQMLETAAQDAGRLLLIGTAQTMKQSNGTVGLSASAFKNAICNGASGTDSSGNAITIPVLLPPMLKCSQLTVNVTTTSAYNVASTASPTFTYNSSGVLTSTGTSYSYQSSGSGQSRIIVLQLVYLWPTGTGPLGVNLINQPNANRMLTATSVFTTENYACSSSTQTSC